MSTHDPHDPEFGSARLSEPVERYIRQFGNPVLESEAVAMIRAVDPTLDEYEAQERADEEFDFTRPVLGNDWDGGEDEDRWTTIVPLAKLLAIPPRGQDGSEGDMTKVMLFWPQLSALVMPDGEKWDLPEEGVEDGKVNGYGRAALMLWQGQTSWVTALAQWISAYFGKDG